MARTKAYRVTNSNMQQMLQLLLGHASKMFLFSFPLHPLQTSSCGKGGEEAEVKRQIKEGEGRGGDQRAFLSP